MVPSLRHEWPAYDFLEPFVDEIAAFQRKVHSRVLDPLLRLFALLLELPEDYFAKVSEQALFLRNVSESPATDQARDDQAHGWERPTEDHLRYMRYIPNSQEVDAKLEDKQYLNGHT